MPSAEGGNLCPTLIMPESRAVIRFEFPKVLSIGSSIWSVKKDPLAMAVGVEIVRPRGIASSGTRRCCPKRRHGHLICSAVCYALHQPTATSLLFAGMRSPSSATNAGGFGEFDPPLHRYSSLPISLLHLSSLNRQHPMTGSLEICSQET